MPSTYDVKDPKTGTVSRYSSVSYWDKDKKRPRSRNEYLGKVDPATGDLIPKKPRRKKEEAREDLTDPAPRTTVGETPDACMERVRILEARIAELEKERLDLKNRLLELAAGIGG